MAGSSAARHRIHRCHKGILTYRHTPLRCTPIRAKFQSGFGSQLAVNWPVSRVHPNIVPYQVFPTADGFMVLSIGNDPTFKRFRDGFGLSHLLDDERFATNAARVQNRNLVTDTLTPVMKTRTTAEWVDKLEALKIGCGPINTLREVVAEPQVQARGVVVQMA